MSPLPPCPYLLGHQTQSSQGADFGVLEVAIKLTGSSTFQERRDFQKSRMTGLCRAEAGLRNFWGGSERRETKRSCFPNLPRSLHLLSSGLSPLISRLPPDSPGGRLTLTPLRCGVGNEHLDMCCLDLQRNKQNPKTF